MNEFSSQITSHFVTSSLSRHANHIIFRRRISPRTLDQIWIWNSSIIILSYKIHKFDFLCLHIFSFLYSNTTISLCFILFMWKNSQHRIRDAPKNIEKSHFHNRDWRDLKSGLLWELERNNFNFSFRELWRNRTLPVLHMYLLCLAGWLWLDDSTDWRNEWIYCMR